MEVNNTNCPMCPKCKNNKGVRIFADIHTAFKVSESGLYVLVNQNNDPENIKENSINCECTECDTKIDLSEEQIEDFYNKVIL